MLMIFSVIALSSIGLLAFRQLTIINKPLIFKEHGIIIGNIFWLIGLLILATSVLYPVVRHLWCNELISVGYQYFIHSFIPVTFITTFLAAIFSVPKDYRKYIIILGLAVLLTWISSIKVSYNMVSASVVVTAIFLILQMLILLLKSSNYFKKMPPEKIMAMIFESS